jgi:hypothetical protein
MDWAGVKSAGYWPQASTKRRIRTKRDQFSGRQRSPPKPSMPQEDALDSLPDTKQLEAVTDRAIAVSDGKRVTQ